MLICRTNITEKHHKKQSQSKITQRKCFANAGARPLIRRDSKLMDGGLNATPGTICGLDYMRDPKLNKGSSFTIEERQTLGIHGLLPPR